MKKTLSVLLSLLMVVSCMTCLFTMPASAVETPEAQTSGESLPENMLANVEGITLFLADGKTIAAGEYYQLDLTVTTDDTTAKFYPVFNTAENAAVTLSDIVGVRYDEPGAVVTVYNYVQNAVTADANAAVNAAGTFTYTYVFAAATADINNIVLPNSVVNANLFALKGTDWDNFYHVSGQIVRYMVKEGDNVFQRFYGYRTVGTTAAGGTSYTISAKLGGDYYGLMFKGGNNYVTNLNLRVPTGAANYLETSSNYKQMPHYNYYEITQQEYETVYTALRDELVAAGKYEETTANRIFGQEAYRFHYTAKRGSGNAYLSSGQVLFNDSFNSYAKFWTNGTGWYYMRRTPVDGNTNSRISFLDYYKNGTKVVTSNNNIYSGDGTSAAGRRYGEVDEMRQTGVWFNANYTIKAPNARNLQEASTAFYGYNAAMGVQTRLAYVNGEWVFNSTYNTIVVPNTQNAYVAFGMDTIRSGCTYDFDGITVTTNDTAVAPAVKGKDSNGVLKDIHANDDTTSVTVESVDVAKNEAKVSFSYDANHDAYGNFVGWFIGDECLSTEKTATIPYDRCEQVTAVVEYENYLGSVGGFESYKSSVNLVLPNKEITATNAAGDTTTLYVHDGAPTGDKWGIFTNNFWSKVAGYYVPDGYTCDHPYTTEQGAFANKGQQVSVQTSPWNNVKPQYGKNYVRLISATSQAVKAIEGLTPGKQYVLSFYTYVPLADPESGVGAAAVGNNVVDIYNGTARANNRGSKVYTYAMIGGNKQQGVGGKDNQTNSPDGWRKLTMYFTPDQETVYLSITFGSSSSLIDSFLCQEVKEDSLPTSWNFEDGNVTPLGFINSSERYENHVLADGTNGTAKVVDATDADPAKLGNKYLALTAGTAYNNFASANFYYNGTDKYVLSFDMKMINYASAVDSKLEMFMAKSNGTGHAITSYQAANTAVLYSGQSVTRYYENGKSYFRAVRPNANSSHYMFTTRNENDRIYFGEQNGGELWDQWAHWEIEIDPSFANDGYKGFVTFSWHLNSNAAGAILGLDNIKVEKYSTADISAAKENFKGTYAFNVRNKISASVPQGLRFKSSVDLDVVDSLGEGSKIVEYGTLAATHQAYWNGAALGEQLVRTNAKDMADTSKHETYAIAGVAYNRSTGKDVRYSIDEETNVVTFTGVLIGMSLSQYDTKFVVRGYVIIEDANGMRTVVYGNVQELSLVDAAQFVVDANPDDVNVEGTDANIADKVLQEYREYKGIE